MKTPAHRLAQPNPRLNALHAWFFRLQRDYAGWFVSLGLLLAVAFGPLLQWHALIGTSSRGFVLVLATSVVICVVVIGLQILNAVHRGYHAISYLVSLVTLPLAALGLPFSPERINWLLAGLVLIGTYAAEMLIMLHGQPHRLQPNGRVHAS